MKTTFTSEDLKNLIEQIFNGNLRQSLASKGSVSYINENSEEIILVDEDNQQTKRDLAEYLNVYFYNWKERLVDTGERFRDADSKYAFFEDWVESLNGSMDKSYALVEKMDEEVVASPDIDSAAILAKVTFIVQSNKIANLDYYVTKLRNSYLGKVQDIQNAYGEMRKSFLTIGTLIYEQEPFMSPLGETMVVSLNFRLSYLNDAAVFSDTKIELSLDNGVNFEEMPITKATMQDIFSVDPVPTMHRPDLTGAIATTLSMTKALTFYDYNKSLTNALDELFWSLPAYMIDGVLTTPREVNVPVYLRVTKNGHTYIYKDVIEQMEKAMTNNDFNVCSLSLKTWGKV